MSKHTILVIEDDVKVRKFIVSTLEYNDYHVIESGTGQHGITLMNANNPDLILLDLGLPDLDGIEVIKVIRSYLNIPIIILSARTEDNDKVLALDLGADDYLTKPFSVDELLARLRANLRRSQNQSSEQVLSNGNLVMDPSLGVAWLNQQELHLTPIEFKLLELFMMNQDKVLSYNTILKAVWGYYSDNIPALRVFVTTLRRKLEKYDEDHNYIQTHVGVGYRMIKMEG